MPGLQAKIFEGAGSLNLNGVGDQALSKILWEQILPLIEGHKYREAKCAVK
jgi:hypothetical protein